MVNFVMDLSSVDPNSGSAATEEFDTLLHQALLERIGRQRYEAWFPGKVRFSFNDEFLTAGVANLILQNVFQRSFTEVIREAASLLLDRPVEVRYRIDPELFQRIRAEQARVDAEGKAKTKQPELFESASAKPQMVGQAVPPAAKRRWRQLADFVVGACNRVAFAAATSVVEEPGQGPNPLVLHGPVGTGKTHLLEGIASALRRRRPETRIVYVSAEDFTNRFVAAVRFGKQSAFRRFFRTADAFLLDDLNFLAKKRATQEEFLHTFDALLGDGRQVVLSCDCHPRLNDDFAPELMDRLLGGAIWGLLPPDGESRLALLRAKSVARGQESGVREQIFPDEVLTYLAENLRGNVRELEGALHSLRHFSRVAGRRIDRELAKEALGDLLRHAVRVVRVEDVENAVSEVLRLPGGTLRKADRAWSVSHPRMLAMYLCRKHTAASFGEISLHFGGKGHSNAVAAEKKVRQWLNEDTSLAAGGREWPVKELLERVEREMMK